MNHLTKHQPGPAHPSWPQMRIDYSEEAMVEGRYIGDPRDWVSVFDVNGRLWRARTDVTGGGAAHPPTLQLTVYVLTDRTVTDPPVELLAARVGEVVGLSAAEALSPLKPQRPEPDAMASSPTPWSMLKDLLGRG